MTYFGMPFGMWALFAGSFQKQLTEVLGYDTDTAKAITKKAKPKYKVIIADLPEFEKADRFKMNIVNCAMIGAFILSMPERPKVDRLTDYYAKSMMTKPMKWFCQMSGKSKFTEKDIAGMKATAALRAADRNPYSWNMEFYEYPDNSGYEGRFTKCGICVLLKHFLFYFHSELILLLVFPFSLPSNIDTPVWSVQKPAQNCFPESVLQYTEKH